MKRGWNGKWKRWEKEQSRRGCEQEYELGEMRTRKRKRRRAGGGGGGNNKLMQNNCRRRKMETGNKNWKNDYEGDGINGRGRRNNKGRVKEGAEEEE